ncbi:MAG TPA: hypothetical protein VNX70_15630 [Bryobacteraceae bacterium]|nr:hypothetical protein [Bryobacteraceae bacterium]
MLLAPESFAQVSSNVSLSNGVQLTITCNSNPSALKIDLEPASGNSFYRIFRDENNLAIFAYQLQVERTPDGDHFRITAKPAGDDFAAKFPNADGGKPAPSLPEPRVSPLLASGDKFTIDIAVIPGIADNLSDTAQIRLNARGVSSEQASRAAPLQFVGLKVQINGQTVSASGPGATVAGRYVMFYVPGHGAYFLSSEPVESPAFVKIGVVDHAHLRFTLDNETYDCDSDAPILRNSDRGEIWVFHDPNYKPSGNWTNSDPSTQRDEFFAAASNSLKWWLP